MAEMQPDMHEETPIIDESTPEQPVEKVVPKSKSQVKRAAIQAGKDVEAELKKFEEKAKEVFDNVKETVEEDVPVVEAEVDKFAKELEGKTVTELVAMHDIAIRAEDEAKRELHVLRLRAANMATIVDAAAEKEITDAKAKVSEAIAWLHAIERRIYGVPRDIWGSPYGRANG